MVDNYGDVGVCWRLARDLAARGETVRLWLDDCSALAWMTPAGALGVEVRPWTPDAVWPEPNEVVVEAFGSHEGHEIAFGCLVKRCLVNAEFFVPRDWAGISPGAPFVR